jgi:hypothetical protein
VLSKPGIAGHDESLHALGLCVLQGCLCCRSERPRPRELLIQEPELRQFRRLLVSRVHQTVFASICQMLPLGLLEIRPECLKLSRQRFACALGSLSALFKYMFHVLRRQRLAECRGKRGIGGLAIDFDNTGAGEKACIEVRGNCLQRPSSSRQIAASLRHQLPHHPLDQRPALHHRKLVMDVRIFFHAKVTLLYRERVRRQLKLQRAARAIDPAVRERQQKCGDRCEQGDCEDDSLAAPEDIDVLGKAARSRLRRGPERERPDVHSLTEHTLVVSQSH